MPLDHCLFKNTIRTSRSHLCHIQKVETRRSGWSLAEVGRSSKAEGEKVPLILHFTLSKYFGFLLSVQTFTNYLKVYLRNSASQLQTGNSRR